MPRNQKDFTYDNAMLMKDAGAITSPTAGTVATVARVLDFGAARIDGRVICDVSAIAVGNTDNLYTIEMQVSSSPTFASDINTVQALRLGNATATGQSASTVIGRYELTFSNEQNGTTYRYGRIFIRPAGTSPSINNTAFIVQEF